MIGLTIEEFEKISKDEVLLSQLKSLEVELSDIKVDFFVVVASAIKERKLLGPVDNYFSKRYIPSR